MTVPTIYRSTDASAPALTGQSASLTALLDAVLVNGYGSKAAAGWTKPYSGAAGQVVYRQGGSGYQGYLQVNDAGPGAGTFKEARVNIYDTMTAWNVGTLASPLGVLRKSATLDAVARPWIIFADAKTFYMAILSGDHDPARLFFVCGHFIPVDPADASPFMIISRTSENVSTLVQETPSQLNTAGTVSGHHVVKNAGGTASQPVGIRGDMARGASTSTFNSSNALPFPNPTDSAVYIAPFLVYDGSSNIRGRMRGMWQFCHPPSAVADGDTFDATGEYAGRQFMMLNNLASSANTTCVLIETTDWDAA